MFPTCGPPILALGKLTRDGFDLSMKDGLRAIGQSNDRVTVVQCRNSLWVKFELVGQPSLVAPVTAGSGEVPGSALAASSSSPPGYQSLTTTRPLRWMAPGERWSLHEACLQSHAGREAAACRFSAAVPR